MILLGNSEKERNEKVKTLTKKGKQASTSFLLLALCPILIYFLFYFWLPSKPVYNQVLEQSVALVNTGTGTGTAFLVSPTKLLTAKHVLKGKQTGDLVDLIFEKSDPQFAATAKVIWVDSSNDPEPNYYLKDVAILELESPSTLPEDYPYLTLGQSSGVNTLSEVIVIGYPSGLLSTTSGNISNDNLRGVELFQLDVESFPGNSGGPLILKETEEVIGMIVAGLTEEFQGINFANKIDNILTLIEEESQIDIYE